MRWAPTELAILALQLVGNDRADPMSKRWQKAPTPLLAFDEPTLSAARAAAAELSDDLSETVRYIDTELRLRTEAQAQDVRDLLS